jgi:hypothetical protein
MNAVVGKADPIRVLRKGVNVRPLLDELEAQPELWNQNVFRTVGDAIYAGPNPHRRVSDIIVRFNDWKNWRGDRARFNEPHESVWWAPYRKLPYLKPLVFDLMRLFEAEALGMVLITRIPAFGEVRRHIDSGWHAKQYLKFGLSLKAAPGQKFCYQHHAVETEPGDLFAFDNSKPHWVTNPTEFERWTLIICMRLEQPVCMDCAWAGPPPVAG